MNSLVSEFLHKVALGIEVAGVSIIALGALITLLTYLRRTYKSRDWGENIPQFRRGLAKAILLGLEFLVGADIIQTVTVEPELQNLYALGLVVVIRTFLSFSLEIEIEGRPPWRKSGS